MTNRKSDGKFLGGIAVVVSLIYLAGQIRQSSRLLKISTTAAISESDNSLISAMIQSPDLGRMWEIESEDFESLPEMERNRLGAYLHLQISIFYRNYYFAKDSATRDAVWAAEQRGSSAFLRRAWVQQAWAGARHGYSHEFRDHVDGLIREGEAAG